MLNTTVDAEISVIGSMLIDERCVGALMRELEPEDFPAADLRHVFEAIRSLWLERAAIDPVTVLDRLGSKSYEPTLREAMQVTPTAANCLKYAQILREHRQLRDIQSACAEILDAGEDLAAARDALSRAAALLSDRRGTRSRSYEELVTDFLQTYDDRTPPDFLDWGIPALNEKAPIGPGRFVILAADSSVGKTALALQFAMSIARKKRVGFFSYETSLGDTGHRLLANDADVRLGMIKHRRLNPRDIGRIVEAGKTAGRLSLRVDEAATYTVERIRAETIAWGYQVIFVDYVQLIPTRKSERYDAVTEISIQLHAMAQELGVTVIGLSQVTVPETDKKGDRRYISMQDLRESRQLKQDADLILLLDLVEPKNREGNRILQIGKNRDGELGYMVLSFDAPHMRFDYVPPMDTEDEAERKAREQRLRKQAENREARREKREAEAREKAELDAAFRYLEDGEATPFEG